MRDSYRSRDVSILAAAPRAAELADVHRSPPLPLLAVLAAVLSIAGALTHPLPAAAFFQLGASILIGLFAATAVSRLLFHRIDVAGVHIALFGGMAAAVFLGLSGLIVWALSQLGSSTEGAGALLALARGTALFGHTATLGLLLAGISIPCLVFGLMPRWACWFGILVAALAELSTLGLLASPVAVLAPVARYLALAWMIIAGFTIPMARAASVERTTEPVRRAPPMHIAGSRSREPRERREPREAYRRGRTRSRRYRGGPATPGPSLPETRRRPPETHPEP